MPSINALQDELKDQGLTVLLVDLWEKRERVAATVKERRYTLPVLLDAAGEVSKAYRVRATPTVFLIGREGMLLGSATGPVPWTQPAGRALLAALLKRPAPRSSADGSSPPTAAR